MSSRLGTALRRNRGLRGTLTVAATVAVSAALLAPAPQAQASTTTTASKTSTTTLAPTYRGTMRMDFTARSAPTVKAPGVVLLRQGTVIPLICKVYADSVYGNYLWYRTSQGRWVTAYYVNVIGAAPPFCGNGTWYTGRVTISSLTVRNGPNTADRNVGSVSGTLANLICKVNSQNVDGNSIWYQLTGGDNTDGGRWVPARYVANIGYAPRYC